jgi:hypothetical protein
VLSGGQGSFKARDGGRLCSHSFCHLRLGEARVLSRLEQGIEQDRFFTFDTLNFGSDARTAHELLYQLIMRSHV